MDILKNTLAAIQRDLLRYPMKSVMLTENQEHVKSGLERLRALVGSAESVEAVLYQLGLRHGLEYTQPSSWANAAIYDVLDTYELASKLQRHNGNWDRAWEEIAKELGSPMFGFDAVNETVVWKLKEAFVELRERFEHQAAFPTAQNVGMKNGKPVMLLTP